MKPTDSEGAALPDSTSVYIYAPDDDNSKIKEPEIWLSLSDAISERVDGYGLWSASLRGVLDEYVREVRQGEMGSKGVAALLREYADKIDAAAAPTPAR